MMKQIIIATFAVICLAVTACNSRQKTSSTPLHLECVRLALHTGLASNHLSAAALLSEATNVYEIASLHSNLLQLAADQSHFRMQAQRFLLCADIPKLESQSLALIRATPQNSEVRYTNSPLLSLVGCQPQGNVIVKSGTLFIMLHQDPFYTLSVHVNEDPSRRGYGIVDDYCLEHFTRGIWNDFGFDKRLTDHVWLHAEDWSGIDTEDRLPNW